MSRLDDRLKRETDIYDKGALNRDGFEAAMAYLNAGIGKQRRNEVIREALQETEGMQVLEIGSQAWEWCLHRYGYQPKHLTCVNISEAELQIGRARAAELKFNSDFRKMDAHHLDFPDESLDFVFGVAILHHLDIPCAMREISRVLRVNGKILFVEPLRGNPVGRFIRWVTPRARTPDEMPLGRRELQLIASNFDVRNYYSEMLSVLATVLTRPLFQNPINSVTKISAEADDLLVWAVPALGIYYRSVVIYGSKKPIT